MQPEALLKKPLEALDHAWLTEWAAHHATEAMRTGSFASLAAPPVSYTHLTLPTIYSV